MTFSRKVSTRLRKLNQLNFTDIEFHR